MVKLRIYIDTSVIGGCLDEEFQRWSQALMAMFREGQAVALISSLVTRELEDAPPRVRAVLDDLPEEAIEEVEVEEAAAALARDYLAAGIVGPASQTDAEHVATATLARTNVLASWNFRHIVNLNRIRLFNSVNLRQGLMFLDIRSPREVVDEG